MNNKTINYYNKYTKSFIQTTRSVDFTNIQNKFLSYLPSGASILDLGAVPDAIQNISKAKL